MKITYYRFENDSLNQIRKDLPPSEWKDNLHWVDIRIRSRKELVEYFTENSFLKGSKDYIEHPENHHLAKVFEKFVILNLEISKKENIYEPEYVTIISDSELVVSIIPEYTSLLEVKELPVYITSKFSKFSYFLYYALTANIISLSDANMGITRDSIHQIEDKFSGKADSISPSEIMSCERNIRKLTDIIEDQYIGLEFLTSLTEDKTFEDNSKPTKELLKGFDPLIRIMDRLGKQAESFRLQYMLLQQEKSTRKINTLTIIQAIFVPLTFIAGVYGMNFLNMPGLQFEYGYYIVWGVFVIMASWLLFYFYRHGWFD